MHQIRDALCRPLAATLATSAIVALVLAACGGSSATGSKTNAAATAATSGSTSGSNSGSGNSGFRNGTTGSGGARPRFTAIRECLRRNGVNLPTQPGAARGLFLGGAELPKGVSRAQLQAAMRKCVGGGFLAGRAGQGRFLRSRSPRFQAALSAFAACLRKNGVAVPTPNTSGNGPVFSTKGIDTASPQFKAATAKCRPALTAALSPRGLRGTAPGAPGSAAPGAQPTG
ncbi:MAG TPA: hypothetical protein VGY30_03100 [Solirubrobacteraceae bacterium]|jgi:hypothetical protein|nr:hypothetical protein [Solirubrobacteraceae bacterium]